MKTKYTPGPWTVMEPRKTGGSLGDDGDRGIEAQGMVIAEAWEHCPTKGNPDGTRVDALANARLIALAPELAEALREIAKHDYFDDHNRAQVPLRLIEFAQALLAKLDTP